MFEQLIQQAAARHNIDPQLLSRLVQQESSGNPNAVSPKGAAGLGQLMPGTAKMMGVTDVHDPAQNINASAGYLSQLARSHNGDMRQALAAYNWGPGNLARAGGDVSRAPPETQTYLQRLLSPGGGLPPEPLPAPPPAPPGDPAMAQAVAQVAPPAAPAAPAAQPMPPSQQTNQELMMAQVAQGGLADRGTLSSLLLGLPGAGAVGMVRKPTQAAPPSPFGMGVA